MAAVGWEPAPARTGAVRRHVRQRCARGPRVRRRAATEACEPGWRWRRHRHLRRGRRFRAWSRPGRRC